MFRSAIKMAFLGVLALPAATQATQLTWQITGQVSNIIDTTTVGGPFAVGDPFTHVFTIDDSVPPSSVGVNSSEFAAIVSSRFEIPSRGFSIDWNNGNNVRTVNFGVGSDVWKLQGFSADVTPSLASLGTGADGPVNFFSFALSLSAPVGTFGSDPPPLVQPDPAWTNDGYVLDYISSGVQELYTVFLRIDSFQAVPEPGSLALLAVGACGLMRLRRRGRTAV